MLKDTTAAGVVRGGFLTYAHPRTLTELSGGLSRCAVACVEDAAAGAGCASDFSDAMLCLCGERKALKIALQCAEQCSEGDFDILSSDMTGCMNAVPESTTSTDPTLTTSATSTASRSVSSPPTSASKTSSNVSISSASPVIIESTAPTAPTTTRTTETPVSTHTPSTTTSSILSTTNFPKISHSFQSQSTSDQSHPGSSSLSVTIPDSPSLSTPLPTSSATLQNDLPTQSESSSPRVDTHSKGIVIVAATLGSVVLVGAVVVTLLFCVRRSRLGRAQRDDPHTLRVSRSADDGHRSTVRKLEAEEKDTISGDGGPPTRSLRGEPPSTPRTLLPNDSSALLPQDSIFDISPPPTSWDASTHLASRRPLGSTLTENAPLLAPHFDALGGTTSDASTDGTGKTARFPEHTQGPPGLGNPPVRIGASALPAPHDPSQRMQDLTVTGEGVQAPAPRDGPRFVTVLMELEEVGEDGALCSGRPTDGTASKSIGHGGSPRVGVLCVFM